MKFPKNLYIKIGDDGSGNEYFDPHRSIDTMVDAGETAKVGVYRLANVIEAHGSVTVVTAKPVRKANRKARR